MGSHLQCPLTRHNSVRSPHRRRPHAKVAWTERAGEWERRIHFIHDFLLSGAPGRGCATTATARGTPLGLYTFYPGAQDLFQDSEEAPYFPLLLFLSLLRGLFLTFHPTAGSVGAEWIAHAAVLHGENEKQDAATKKNGSSHCSPL